MDDLNDQLRREIPRLAQLPELGDAPDEMVHRAADALVRPLWDRSASPLSDDPREQSEMRRGLWRLLGKRIDRGDVLARVALERWLLLPFVSNDPIAEVLRPELSDSLRIVVDEYERESEAFLNSLRGLAPALVAIIDETIEEYDGLVLLTSILERVLDHLLPTDRQDRVVAHSGDAQMLLDAIDEWIGVNGYIDEAIRETVPAALRGSALRDQLTVGPRLRGVAS